VRMDKAEWYAALREDTAARMAAEKIFAEAIADYPKMPGAAMQAGKYVQALNVDLYDQLKLVLEDPAAWHELMMMRIVEQEQPAACTAALAQTACFLLQPEDEKLAIKIGRMAEKKHIAQQSVDRVLRCYRSTPLTGAFDGKQAAFPCLDAEQVSRLGVLLGAVLYREWVRRCEQDREGRFSIECADPGTMAAWGFGWAEMMCAKADEHAGADYAQMVSMVALANLTMDFDNWEVLKSGLDSMLAEREVFRAAFEKQCSEMGLEAEEDGHITLQNTAVPFDRAAWLAALEDDAHAKENVLYSMEEQEEEEHNDDVTE